MSGTRLQPALVFDANVLIDYSKSDVTLLRMICREVGQIHVAQEVLAEVHELDRDLCASLEITVVEPELQQLVAAAAKRGRLSFEDRLCLVLAREYSATCVTNDRRLRKECDAEVIPT